MPVEVVGDSTRGGEVAFARLVVDGDLILEADTPGLTRSLAGLTLLEAAAVPGETLAADATANALAQVFTATPAAERVVVAMSGGVDSAVALLRSGANAVGVTLRLWADPAGRAAERVCCSPAAVIAARETCHALGRPHVTLDLREAFRANVITPFVEAYAAGQTPNPCSRCNGAFRFDELLAFCERAGARTLVTGHYARIVERDGVPLIARGVDRGKDQSYMLATVALPAVAQLRFPLGEATKDEIRAEARVAGLAAATAPESQEACFLGGDDYRDFLEREGLQPTPGPIVDDTGRQLGRHAGLWRYTPGQRRGIGVASDEPLYAVRADRKTNTLVVGRKAALAVNMVDVRGSQYVPVTRADAQLRYRSAPAPAAVEATPTGFRLSFERPQYGVAPGQVAVLYDDGVVVGAGVIEETGG